MPNDTKSLTDDLYAKAERFTDKIRKRAAACKESYLVEKMEFLRSFLGK